MNTTAHAIKNPKQSGFAILEALIAFIVLAVGLLVLLAFHGSSLQSIGDAKVRVQAMDLAQDKIQDLRSFLDNDSPGDWGTRLQNGADNFGAANGYAATFARTWAVDTSDPLLADVTVTVTWTDRDNQNQSISLSSTIYKVDPTEAAKILNKAIYESYLPTSTGGGDETPTFEDEDEKMYDDNNGQGWDPVIDGTTRHYNYRLKITGEVDKKDTQTVTLPEPVVNPTDGDVAVCDFGSTASYPGAQKPISLKSGETLVMTTISITTPDGVTTNPASYDSVSQTATAGYVTIDNTGEVTLSSGAVVYLDQTYSISYQIQKGSTTTTETVNFTVEEFDGSYLCYAYFDTLEGDDKGWSGTLSFSVSGGVFCHPVTGVASPSGTTTYSTAFGQISFDKTYTEIISDQSLFIQIAANQEGCTAQL